jgi:DNA-binding NarL/FixJ family response regulator
MTREPLPPRDLEVLQLMVEGLTDEEIALGLGVSLDTVKTRVQTVVRYFNSTSRTQAVVRAIKAGCARLS